LPSNARAKQTARDRPPHTSVLRKNCGDVGSLRNRFADEHAEAWTRDSC